LVCTGFLFVCLEGQNPRIWGPAKIRQAIPAYLISIGIWAALSLMKGWQYLIFDWSVNIHSTPGQMLLLAEAGKDLRTAYATDLLSRPAV
jgi:hypothetical protein